MKHLLDPARPFLSNLSEAQRSLALERFRILRPFFEEQIPLPEVAHTPASRFEPRGTGLRATTEKVWRDWLARSAAIGISESFLPPFSSSSKDSLYRNPARQWQRSIARWLRRQRIEESVYRAILSSIDLSESSNPPCSRWPMRAPRPTATPSTWSTAGRPKRPTPSGRRITATRHPRQGREGERSQALADHRP